MVNILFAFLILITQPVISQTPIAPASPVLDDPIVPLAEYSAMPFFAAPDTRMDAYTSQQNVAAISTLTVIPVDDNLLNGTAPFLNLGMHENFEIANYTGDAPSQVGLLRFDLSSIPANATVVSATLYLYKSYPQGKGGGTITATVYSISRVNRDWVAGVGDLDPSRPGESCWAAKACSGNSVIITRWAGSAGLGTANTDYETPAMGSAVWTPGDDPLGQEYAIQLNAGRVACWFGDNNTNYGIVVKNLTGGSDHYGQSEHQTTAYRPKLVVRYTLDIGDGGVACGGDGGGGGGVDLPFKFFLPNLTNQYRTR